MVSMVPNNPIIDSIVLYLTTTCNLNCLYCFEREGTYKNCPRMSNRVARKSVDFLIKQLKRSPKNKGGTISFFGGEPLLCWDLIKSTVQYALRESRKINRQMLFAISTNGILLDREKVFFLRKHRFQIELSIDSHIKKTHDELRPTIGGKGSFDRILKKLHLFKKGDLLLIKVTITPKNLLLFDCFKYFSKIRAVKGVYFVPFISINGEYQFKQKDVERYKIELDKYADYIIRNWTKGKFVRPQGMHVNLIRSLTKKEAGIKSSFCRAAGKSICICANGEIYACETLANVPEFYLGSIFEGINSKLLLRLIERMKTKEGCRKCPTADLCDAECFFCSHIMNNGARKWNLGRDIIRRHDRKVVKRLSEKIDEILA